MRLELLDEFRIDPRRRLQLAALLTEAFPRSLSARTYAKQVPQRRLLALSGDTLIGHVGLEHRIVGLTSGPAAIFGLIDVCVSQPARSRGVASGMLAHLEGIAREGGVDFAVLFARDGRLYKRCGYHHRTNTVRWAKIHEHKTIGLGEAAIPELMVKELGQREWPDGLVDLLGYLF